MSTNPFALSSIEQEGSASAPATDNPYALNNIARDQQQDLRVELQRAVRTNPDQAAEVERLAKRYPAPKDVLLRNLQDVQFQAAVDQADEQLRTSPKLAEYMRTKPWAAKQAHDDVSTLGEIEQFLRDTGGSVKAGVFNTSKGAAGVFRAGLELVAPVLDPLESVTAIGGNPLRRLAEGFAMQADAAGATAKAAAPKTEGVISGGFQSGIQSLTQNVLALPMAFFPGGQGAALSLMTASTGGQSYQDAREKGLSMSQALPFAASQAAIEYATEKLPLDQLIGGIKAGAPLLQTLAKQMALEIPGEQVATILQDLNEWAVLNPGKPFADYIAERPNAAAQTLVATIVGTGGNVVIAKGIETATKKLMGDAYDAGNADTGAQNLQNALALATESKLRERNPEEFRSLVQSMVQGTDGAPTEVYVDAEVLNQLAPEVLNQLPQSVRDALPDALAANDVVAIPVGDVLTVAPGTPLEAMLVENARIGDPRAMSQAEAKEAGAKAQEFLTQEAQRVIAQAQDQQAMQASSDRVKQGVLDQLNTVGRFRKDVNDAYATWTAAFYTTMAGRLGITPEEMQAKYPLRVVGQSGQGGVLNAMADQTQTPEFQNWFAESKVRAPDGKPLVVYHATTGNFTEFKPGGNDPTISGQAMWFTDSRERQPAMHNVASRSADFRDGTNVMPVYLNMARPLVIDNKDMLDWASQVFAEGSREFPQILPKKWVDEVRRGGEYDGIIFDGPALGWKDSVREYIVFEPTQIKSATGNNGQFNPNDPNILNQSATLRSGEETLAAYGLPLGGKYNTRDIAAALEARQREKWGKIDPTDRSPEAVAKIADWMAEEVRFEMQHPRKSGVGWYSYKFQRALDTFAEVFPELKKDKDARATLTALIAITSDGQKVVPNFRMAVDLYSNFRKTGKFSTDRGHARMDSIQGNVELLQKMLEDMGPKAMRKYLLQEATVSELRKRAKAEGVEFKTDYQAHIKLPMAAVTFGPKLGAFYANLMGAHGYLTMDRWWSRTFNRYRGTLLQAPTKDGLARIKELMGHPEWSDDQAIAATVEPRKSYEAKNFKNGTEIEKAANTVYKAAFENLEDAPFNATDRTFMLEAVAKAQQVLEAEGRKISIADIQAVLWYYEKRLYGELGARQTADVSYEDAAKKVVAEQADAGATGGPDAQGADAGAGENDTGAAAGVSEETVAPGLEPFDAGEVNGRLEQAGDRAGRADRAGSAPLPGAPVIEGATGPDPRVVAVAEQYARDNGIDLQRQAEYVQVDPARAARIAAAYEAMQHSPQDPAVKEAYDNLIRQTVAQYRALEAAGYKFWFIDPTNDPYKSPWDAMRDMRATQSMGVFPTVAGFGSGATDVDITDNPLMADTGITWPYGSANGELKPVLANDLFRAVHDAFGHGLEGTGFRAQGEENAWQAHIRLFTGSAKGAITSETRGQNSWLNFGPYGESNRTAKVEDTVFADQKTGLMPEWTWTEGLAGDMPTDVLAQGPRGTFNPKSLELALNENADLSTFLHETGHFFLEVMADLASQPGAPADVQQDLAALMKWFGVADLATWNGYSLDQKRPYHERFAESFEQYLLEGKAPSVELQPLFRKFRAWMLNVYKSIKAFIDVHPDSDMKLSDEVRQVFDRMLASDEQIQQANEVAGLLPNEEADAEANEKLTARSLRDLKWTVNARAKAIKELQKQAATLRKEVEAEVTAEVNAMPEFRAQAALDALQVNPDYTVALNAWKEQRAAALTAATEQIKADLLAANPDVKGLQKGQLLAKNKKAMANQAEAKVLEWEAQNPKPRKADNATDADLAVVADSFGYSTVEGMLQAIDAIGKKSDVIEGMTDQRMLERHGDLIDQRAIEAAANEAVHNEARARSLATELRSQAEMLNPRADTGRTNAKGSKITVNAIVEAAKQFAANVVSKTPLRDLKAKAWQHTAAERRAGKRWQEATAAGKTQDAVKAKQDQVLNNAAAKAAMDAQVEMRKMLEFFKRVVKDGNEKTVEKGRDPDVVNAARAVLAAYGVAPKAGKTALEYMALVEKNDPAMHAALQPSVQGALNMAQPLDALTMEELRGLHEEIQAMWHLAKRSRQMEVDGNMLDLDDAEAELQDRMQEIGVPDTMPGDSGAMTSREELVRKLQFAGSILRRVEQWADNMGSEFTKLVFQPIKDAADRYRTDRVKYRKAYQALVDAVAPSLRKGEIAAPELGYTFGKGHNGIGHAELLHAILHTGNESNKRKLLLGRNWATENADGTLDTSKWDAFIERMQSEGLLTKAHYDFAQGVWDLLEQTKPLAQKTHRDVFGRYFAEVTADSFDTPFGSYRGGYVPAQADPRIVQDADLRKLAEAENENMAFAFPSTNKGFTKGRVEYNRPLMLDLRTIGQHIDKVLLFSHMEPAVRDVQKLLSRKGVSYSLGRIDPTAYAGMLTPWLSRSARQVVETPIVGDGGISRVMAAARARAGMTLMFANVSNAIQQLTGFSLAAIKVKPASMMRATAQFIASPKQTAKAVSDASPFMANRMENEISAINDAMDKILLDPSLYEKSLAWTQKHAYFLQTAIANSMEPIIWTAAYNDALTEGQSEKDAVRHADSVVRTTQGSTLPEDVSRIETGPAWARLFTQFIGYFNMMANTNATALQQVARETGLRKGAGKALGIITLGMLAPIWVAEAIALAMRGGPDDEDDDGYLDDWLAAVFGMGTIKGSLAMVPFVGQAAQLTLNRFNDNPADDKFSLSPAVSLIESTVSAPASVYKAITDNGNRQKAVRDVATAVSVVTGLPAFAIARPLGYLAGVEQGKIEPTSAADMARGLVTGTASPASK